MSKISDLVTNPDDDVFFIGHSVGCQAILRYLETLDEEVRIGGVIFIAPWMHLDEKTIKEEGEEVVQLARPWVETPINWEKVKSHTDKFVCDLSDNDPYVPLSNKDLFKNNLGAEIIIEHNKWHFTESNNVSENETALRKVIDITQD